MAPVVLASAQGVGGVLPVEFRVLGGLEVLGMNGRIELRGAKRRASWDCYWRSGDAWSRRIAWSDTCGTTIPGR